MAVGERITPSADERFLSARTFQFERRARTVEAVEAAVCQFGAFQDERAPVGRRGGIRDRQLTAETIAVYDQGYELRPFRRNVPTRQNGSEGGKRGRIERQAQCADPQVAGHPCRTAAESPRNAHQFVQEMQRCRISGYGEGIPVQFPAMLVVQPYGAGCAGTGVVRKDQAKFPRSRQYGKMKVRSALRFRHEGHAVYRFGSVQGQGSPDNDRLGAIHVRIPEGKRSRASAEDPQTRMVIVKFDRRPGARPFDRFMGVEAAGAHAGTVQIQRAQVFPDVRGVGEEQGRLEFAPDSD
ncbi:MAG: hypothetical protein F4Y22_09720 [Gammaproteobacteria bacterium]|nr:hypothetical protein [Gammaproteobacteria bacterium]